MAESFIWVDGAGGTHNCYVKGVTTERHVIDRTEQGWDNPEREDVSEITPGKYTDLYRGSVYGPRMYSYEVVLEQNSRAALEGAQGEWEGWHDIELGEGYVKRITASGVTRCLDAIPLPAQGRALMGEHSERFRQGYMALNNPFWRTESQSTASGNYSGAAAVNISCNNQGDIPSYPLITITGIVDTPKVTNSDGDEIEVNKSAANADDEIIIDCRPTGATRRTVKFYEHGAGAGEFCTLSSASKYIELPKGEHNVSIEATAGDAECVLAGYDYYKSLY